VQRFEVFTGAGRRRTWSAEEKARIVAASYVVGETVCSVARRHALTPQQLFTWRREARRRQETVETAAPALFVPAVVDSSPQAAPKSRRRARRAPASPAAIELEIDGVTVRVGRGAEARTVAAVIRALKAGA
jgi:transposase